jgi:hypothetical protein
LGMVFATQFQPADFTPSVLEPAYLATYETNRNPQAQYGEFLAGIEIGLPPKNFTSTLPRWPKPLAIIVAAESYDVRCEDVGYSDDSAECKLHDEMEQANQNVTGVWRSMGQPNTTSFEICGFPCKRNLIWTHPKLVSSKIHDIMQMKR